MKRWPEEITPLPQRTRSILRSTVILSSLVQVVSELVQNSLDAKARSIQVGIDCDDWSCWVQDDGTGFTVDDLESLANNCKADAMRYSTSKVSDGDHVSFGFRGEALASIADLSILEISSRTAKARQSWSVILKGTDALYFGPSLHWQRQSTGTTVCVKDAFHNLPVRRLAHTPSARTLELIGREIETFALVFPNVTFQLQHSRTQEKVMSIPKTPSTLDAFRRIFGRALVQKTHPIDNSYDSLRIEGFISLTGTSTKAYQFLYINKVPMAPCDLHRLLDRKFSASTFARDAYDTPEGPSSRKGPQPGPRKGEKKPVYVLNITIPPILVDNYVEPSKSAVNIQNHAILHSFLSSLVEEFLVRYSFLKPPPQVQPWEESGRTPRKRRKLAGHTVSVYSPGPSQQSHRAAEWDYLPPELELLRSCCSDCSGSCDGCSSCCDGCLYAHEGSDSDPDLPEDTCYSEGQLDLGEYSLSDEVFDTQGGGEVTWMDPATGESFIVDTTSGNSRRALGPGEGNASMPRRTLASESQDDIVQGEMPPWIGDALTANDVYKQKEKPIPIVPCSDTFMSDMRHYELQKRLQFKQSAGQVTNLSSRFSRDDLKESLVINQVDSKFIVCLLPSNPVTDDLGRGSGVSQASSRTLVLVDQHAADERVRVEWLQREICLGYLRNDGGTGIERTILDPPVPVLLTKHEKSTLWRSNHTRDLLASWGVEFSPINQAQESSHLGDDSGYSQVMVTSIPAIVNHRLSSGDELQHFVKGVLGDYSDDFSGRLPAPSLPLHGEDEFSWKRALRHCPTQLLELLNSKACRGAIMFNDFLTIEQCKELMERLSHTAVPFRCAHGRPSIVPLVDLGPPTDLRGAARQVNWGAYEEHIREQARTTRRR